MSNYLVNVYAPFHLAVATGPSIFQPDTLTFFALTIIFAVLVLCVKTSPPVRYRFRVVVACIAPSLLIMSSLFSHEVSLDRKRNSIECRDYWASVPYSTFIAPLTALTDVEIETDGPSKRVVFVFSDRANQYPLGSSFRSGDNAYSVRDRINSFLQQK